jgi:hypothetical protein
MSAGRGAVWTSYQEQTAAEATPARRQSGDPRVDRILALQGTAGNGATARLLVQRSVTVEPTRTKTKTAASDKDFSYSRVDTTTGKTANEDGTETKSSDVTSRKWGTGGASRSVEHTGTTGGAMTSTKDTRAITRGDGKLGGSYRGSTKSGTVDEEGKLVDGREAGASVGGGVIAGKDGVGAFGSSGMDLTQTHAKGVQTGQSVGMDGKFVVNVTQVPDKPEYRISLTISLGANVGASGNVEKDGKYGVSGSVSGSVTATLVHVFGAEETERYLASLAAKGAGGAHQELKVLELVNGGKLETAKAMLSGLQATMMSADGVAALGEGESAELAVDVKGQIQGSAGAKGIGASVGVSTGRTFKRSVARTGGKVVITVTALASDGSKLGGSLAMGVMGAGYGHESTDTAGQSLSFTLDPDNPAFQQDFAAIAHANAIEPLEELAEARPELVSSSTISTGTSTSGGGTADVGPVRLGISDQHSLNESITESAAGTTYTAAGSSGGGAELSALGAKLSHTDKGTVSGTVGPDGVARGDVNTATSDTDLGGSWHKFVDSVSKKPIGTIAGLVTGSTKLLQEGTEVSGMTLTDRDFASIATIAHDPVSWQRAVTSPRLQLDWQATARAIVAADGDRAEIVRVLTAYSAHEHGAAKAIQQIIRPAGSADGGVRYDWPGELSAQKTTYQQLVERGGSSTPDETLAKIDALVADMRAKRDKFADPGAFLEMLTRAEDRRAQVAQAAAAEHHRPSVPTAEPRETYTRIDHEAAAASLAGYQQSLNAFRDQELAAFGVIGAEQAKQHAFFSSPDVEVIARTLTELKNVIYPQWEAALEEARKAAATAGLDPGAIQPAPARSWWAKLSKDLTARY